MTLKPRSPFLDGLVLTLRYPRPLLWAYAFSLFLAWITSIGLRAQYSNVTANSLAAERLIGGFDVGVALDAARRLSDGPPGTLTPSFLTTPLYLLVFFLLVPGTLLTYQTGLSLRLGALLQAGVQSFWSFVRIIMLTLAVAVPALFLLTAIQTAAGTRIDRTLTGRPAALLNFAGYLVLFLVAAGLRLFFDLVEVHAVHRAQFPAPNGRPDRRIRLALRPALTTFRRHFVPAYLLFVLLAILGIAAAALLTRSAMHHLAQPRVWPTFLLAQAGVFALLLTRLWQRAAQTVLLQNSLPQDRRAPIFTQANPSLIRSIEPTMNYDASTFPTPAPDNPVSPILPGPDSNPLPNPGPDPIPGSEPISPSLATPDPGVFHHEVPEKKNLLN